MARFYFDFHDASGILRDEAGEELPSATIARRTCPQGLGSRRNDLPQRVRRASGDGLSQALCRLLALLRHAEAI